MKGSLRQRSPGSWTLRYDGPPDGAGRRKQVVETVRGTKREAESVLRARLAAVENGAYVQRQQETVAEFMGRWLDTYAATNVRPRTLQGYRQCVSAYLVPVAGTPLQRLTPAQLQGVYAGMLSKGLSPTTVVQLHRIVREALSHGVKWGAVVRNIADATSPPRIERKEIKIWGEDTLDGFMVAAQRSRYRNLYQLAAMTGMRRSEICGLQWDSVNFEARRIYVVKTLYRVSGRGLVEGQPKTNKSRRAIALGTTAMELLKAVRNKQMAERLEAIEFWEESGYVFTQPTGNPVDPDLVTKDFHRIVKRAGLPHLSFHGLRHIHATQLMEDGANPKVVSERLGHSTISMTMDTYSHVMPDLQQQAADTLDRRWQRHQ